MSEDRQNQGSFKIVTKVPTQLSKITEEGPFISMSSEQSDLYKTIRDELRDGASSKAIAELLSFSQHVPLPDLIQIKALEKPELSENGILAYKSVKEVNYKKQFEQYERTVWDAIHAHQKEARQKLEQEKFELKRQRATSQQQHRRANKTLQEEKMAHQLSVKEFSLELPQASTTKHAQGKSIKHFVHQKKIASPSRVPQVQYLSQTLDLNQDIAALITSQPYQKVQKPPKPFQTNFQVFKNQQEVPQEKERSQSVQGSPKCKFVIRSDKSEMPLERVNDLTQSLQSKINRRDEGKRQRAFMKFLQNKMSTSQSVDNDIKLINGGSLGLDNKVEVDQDIGLFKYDAEEPLLHHLALLKEYLDRSDKSGVKVTVNNFNIVQNLVMNSNDGRVMLDLQALDLQKQKLTFSVQKALKKLLSKEIQLSQVIQDPVGDKQESVWTQVTKFCEACVNKIERKSVEQLPRVALGTIVVEEPSDNSVVLDQDRADVLNLIKDDQTNQSEHINSLYAHENQTTGSKLDPTHSHYRKYLFKSKRKKRIDSEVQDPIFDDLFSKAASERTNFNESRSTQLKAIDLLFDECLSQVRAWSSSHADLIHLLSDEMKAIMALRLQEATLTTDQQIHDLVGGLALVTQELSRVYLENKRKDKIIKELLAINDTIQSNNELAIKVYSKADQERASLCSQLDQLRFSILNWLPNFVKYSDEDYLLRQVVPILPNGIDLEFLGGSEWWHAQKLQVDNNDEQAMWGLEKDDLAEIEYKGEPLLQKYHMSALWLRSDLCRIQKLLDVPTVTAVDLEQTNHNLKKSEKRNKRLGEEINMHKTNIESMETKIQALTKQNTKNNKELAKIREQYRLALLQLERRVNDKQTQTDLSAVSPRKNVKKVPGLLEKKSKTHFQPRRTTSQNSTSKMQRTISGYNDIQSVKSSESKQSRESIFTLSPDRIKGLTKVTKVRLVKKSISQSPSPLNSSIYSSILKDFGSPSKMLDLIPEVRKSLHQLPKMKSRALSHHFSAQKHEIDTLTHETGALMRKQLGLINAYNIWSSEIRFPDRIWQQFRHRYSEMQAVMHSLVASYPVWENALSLLWNEIDDNIDARLLQAQDFYQLQKHDWRVVLLINVANLDFIDAEIDAIKTTKLRVTFNNKDCRASNLCGKLLRNFKIDIDSAFAFLEQHQLMIEDGIGKNPNVFNAPNLVYLHEAFFAIASELQSNVFSHASFDEFSAPLLTYVHSKLKQKCVQVVLAKISSNNFPTCTVEESKTIKLDDPSIIEEYQLLDLIRTRLVQYTSNDFLRTFPLSVAEFYEVLQGPQFKVRFPARFNQLAFQAFCEQYILKGQDQINRESLKSLEDTVISYQLNYEDALLIGVKSIKVLDDAIETRLKPAFNRFIQKAKAQQEEKRLISIDSFRKICIKLTDQDLRPSKGKPDQARMVKINEMCNELRQALAMKQIEGVDLATFRRAFQGLKISFNSLSKLKVRPSPGLSYAKTEMLTNLKDYLKNALQAIDESQQPKTNEKQINLEHLQCTLKISDYTDHITIQDLRQVLFDEKQIDLESSSSTSSDISSYISPKNINMVNMDLKTVQEKSLKLRPITLISQTSGHDISFKVSEKTQKNDVTALLEQPIPKMISRYKSTIVLDYPGLLLDEAESVVSKRFPVRMHIGNYYAPPKVQNTDSSQELHKQQRKDIIQTKENTQLRSKTGKKKSLVQQHEYQGSPLHKHKSQGELLQHQYQGVPLLLHQFEATKRDNPPEMVEIIENDDTEQTPQLTNPINHSEATKDGEGLPKIKIIKRPQNKTKLAKPARLVSLANQNNPDDGSPLRIMSFKHAENIDLTSSQAIKQKLPINYALKKKRGRLVSVEATKDEPTNLFLLGNNVNKKQEDRQRSSNRNRTIYGVDMNIQTGKSLYESMTSMFPSKISTASNKKLIEAFVPKII